MRIAQRQYGFQSGRRALVFVMALLLAACSAGWRAPMESRSERPSHYPMHKPHKAAIRPGASDYRVRRGDTLYAIAWRANLDFRDIARWNGIRSPYVIYEGQVLRLRPTRASQSRTGRISQPDAATSATSSAGKPESRSASAPKKASPKKKETLEEKSNARLTWAWPVQGQVVSVFKSGDPLNKGIKIASREGSDIRAAEAGKVVYSGSGLIGYGQLIIIKHNEKYLSAYGHNRKLLVEQNQRVTKGQKIAEMGRANDGRPLLHFELRQYGKPMDPLAFLPRR